MNLDEELDFGPLNCTPDNHVVQVVTLDGMMAQCQCGAIYYSEAIQQYSEAVAEIMRSAPHPPRI